MKLVIGIILCLISLEAYSKEVVIVKDKKELYALLTTCENTTQEITHIKVKYAEVGEYIVVKSRPNRIQKCKIKKVVKIT